MRKPKRQRRGERPAHNVFSELTLSVGDEHPLHRLLHRDPKLHRRAARIERIARRIQSQVEPGDWMAFSDQRAQLHADELEIAFNVGFQTGAVAAHAERHSTSAGRGAREDVLARDVRALLVGASLPPDRATSTLLALALALLRSKRSVRPAVGRTRPVRQ